MSEGIGFEPPDRMLFLKNLLNRGLATEEAEQLYESEKRFFAFFAQHISFAYAPNMKITTGVVALVNQ